MYVNDLDISLQQISAGGQRLFDGAASEARRRGHTVLTAGHLLLAFAHTEARLFEDTMHDVGASPANTVRRVRAIVDAIRPGEGRELHVPLETRLLCKLALHRASRMGRTLMTPGDLFHGVARR